MALLSPPGFLGTPDSYGGNRYRAGFWGWDHVWAVVSVLGTDVMACVVITLLPSFLIVLCS